MPLRFLVLPNREGYFVAICLEHFLTGSGRSIPEAIDCVWATIHGHVAMCQRNNVVPFSSLKATPAEYEAMFNDPLATKILGVEESSEFEFEPAVVFPEAFEFERKAEIGVGGFQLQPN